MLSFFPSPNTYFVAKAKTERIYSDLDLIIPTPPPYPVNTNNVIIPEISANGVYLEDLPSGVILYEKNSEERYFPASTTKIASALVALDHFKLDEILVAKTIITEGRTMGLIAGEKLTFESLLYGMLVHSANDASYAIAENFPGGVAQFVVMMNKKASSLNMLNTHFTNPIGFDDENNYSTPSDLAKLAKAALTNKTFTKIVSTRSITVSDIDYIYFHDLRNVNVLLGKIAGVAGVKTGFTQNAGEILITEVKKNGKLVLFVVMKSLDRFKDSEILIDWVFNNYTWKDIETITPVAN